MCCGARHAVLLSEAWGPCAGLLPETWGLDLGPHLEGGVRAAVLLPVAQGLVRALPEAWAPRPGVLCTAVLLSRT
jgi:hypothetical protein